MSDQLVVGVPSRTSCVVRTERSTNRASDDNCLILLKNKVLPPGIIRMA